MGRKSREKANRRNIVSEILNKKRTEYAEAWSEKNAKWFTDKGYYKWMTSLISGYKIILEVGTGDGSGTLELVNEGHKIISIDENVQCLKLAYEKLTDAGVRTKYLRRENINLSADGTYKIQYEGIVQSEAEDTVILIEGDILNDEKLLDWLFQNPKFDAVVCWLIGTHGARRANLTIKNLNIPTPGIYRLKVQNKVYEMADLILRPGGVLHIVDRTERPGTEELKNDFLNAHKDQARVTSLLVQQLDYIDYEEPDNGIEIGLTLGVSGRRPETFNAALTSILSIKPENI